MSNKPDINYGSIYENAVAEELYSKGFELFYYKNKKFGELDFIVSLPSGRILPIDVKSGKHYKRHNAIDNLLSNSAYKIKEGIVLGSDNVSRESKITYLPIYMTMFLDEIN